MRLLMVSNYYESHRGGLDIVAGRVVRELVRRGEDVRWLASDTTRPPSDDELAHRYIPVRVFNTTERFFGVPFPFPSPFSIWRISRSVRLSDAVLLQDSLYPICMLTFLFARLWHRPLLITQHIGIIPYRNFVLRGAMALGNMTVARLLLTHADRVVFISENTARYFSPIPFRLPPKTLFNGVETNIFYPVADVTAKYGLRNRLGLPHGCSIALFVGRFVEKKGLHILRRMARLRDDVHWAFAGWGHLDPEAWGLPNVSVFRDLSGPSLAPLYQASDVFVLPSKGEGFPLVIQEALACGLPVVTSAENATADAAAAPFLYPIPLDESDPEATASAFCQEIDLRLADRETEDRLACQRFRFASERYSWSAAATAYLKLIQDAVFDAKQPKTAKRIIAERP